MNITITYRPFSGTISAWNTLDNTMPEADRENIKRVYQDGDDESWFVSMDTYNGQFHSVTVLDSSGAGQGWNLFLSALLNDDTIGVIYDQVTKWDSMTPRDNPHSLVLAHYKTTVEVSV
jgi:hypothetical protein